MSARADRPVPAPGAPPRAPLFSDPNCPFCHATEEHLHALGLAGAVEWRGVQHAPDLPVPMAPGDPPGEDLGAEVEAVRRLAPEVRIALPTAGPSTACPPPTSCVPSWPEASRPVPPFGRAALATRPLILRESGSSILTMSHEITVRDAVAADAAAICAIYNAALGGARPSRPSGAAPSTSRRESRRRGSRSSSPTETRGSSGGPPSPPTARGSVMRESASAACMSPRTRAAAASARI